MSRHLGTVKAAKVTLVIYPATAAWNAANDDESTSQLSQSCNSETQTFEKPIHYVIVEYVRYYNNVASRTKAESSKY